MSVPPFAITLEEHAMFPALGGFPLPSHDVEEQFPGSQQALKDHSTGRIASMDEGHVSYQIMSHSPGVGNDNPEGCSKANDQMAEAIKKNPNRFGGFATLPMAFPDKAAAELERVVKKLGFLGAMISSHLDDMTHYDDERFWPVFEAAERLDVPIYIHPGPPPMEEMKNRYGGNYSTGVMMGIAMAGWGWHQDVGLHITKLWCAGLFQRFPKLKIIIGHGGELLPLFLDRLAILKQYDSKLDRGDFNDVWNQNIWVTTSGIFTVRIFEMLLKVTKKDHLLYSIDTPYSPSIDGRDFIRKLAKESSLSREELEGFAFGNAKKLFNLDVNLKKF
ncbi:amidohydrolase 2 [Hypoxylon trugodes]|uniref:amidohydrolase 2 n=1 Tax=Hypoxylon trugodes TaxID=326681 RepID=UPI0021992348|nr:amidohydrolase 2 [Hypoxylon trugodes]KAI1382803.1 amidohydrolase 2 [Hypoxylon trugodes]